MVFHKLGWVFKKWKGLVIDLVMVNQIICTPLATIIHHPLTTLHHHRHRQINVATIILATNHRLRSQHTPSSVIYTIVFFLATNHSSDSSSLTTVYWNSQIRRWRTDLSQKHGQIKRSPMRAQETERTQRKGECSERGQWKREIRWLQRWLWQWSIDVGRWERETPPWVCEREKARLVWFCHVCWNWNIRCHFCVCICVSSYHYCTQKWSIFSLSFKRILVYLWKKKN